MLFNVIATSSILISFAFAVPSPAVSGVCPQADMCLSAWNYCGTGPDYCGYNCQGGPCIIPSPCCPKDDMCKSKYGYCGYGDAYCGDGCACGKCYSQPNTGATSVSNSSAASSSSSSSSSSAAAAASADSSSSSSSSSSTTGLPSQTGNQQPVAPPAQSSPAAQPSQSTQAAQPPSSSSSAEQPAVQTPAASTTPATQPAAAQTPAASTTPATQPAAVQTPAASTTPATQPAAVQTPPASTPATQPAVQTPPVVQPQGSSIAAPNDSGKRCTITENFDSLALPDFTFAYGADHLTVANGIASFRLDKVGAPLLVSKQAFAVGYAETRLKIAAGSGVVTAFITQSNNDAADEIDFEFVGKDSANAQTNYYVNGVADYSKMLMFPAGGDMSADFHTYRVDWNAQRVEWSIDGKVVRTLSASAGAIPVKPMSVKLSIWDGTNTSGWAGTVDYSHAPFVAQFDSVTINYAC